MKFFLQTAVLFIILAASTLAVRAQFAQSVVIVFDPPFPVPGQSVTAQALLSGVEPSTATFRWMLNEKVVAAASGKGKETLTFQLGAAPRTTIDVVVTTPGGVELSSTKALTPRGATIVWWTDTSVPVWFLGKAIPSTASNVTVLAVPGPGFGEKPETLLYSWNVNVEPQPGVSGIGRNRFTLKTSQVEDVIHQVTVRISNANQTIAQEAAALIPTRAAELLVYALPATGGTDASGTLSVFGGNAGETYDFIAVPFFFRPDQLKNLKYVWRVNDKAIEGDFTDPDILTLKTAPGGTSQNTIGVDATGLAPNLQRASAFFTANFQ